MQCYVPDLYYEYHVPYTYYECHVPDQYYAMLCARSVLRYAMF